MCNLAWDTTILDGPTLKNADQDAVRRFLELANAERRWSVSPKMSAGSDWIEAFVVAGTGRYAARSSSMPAFKV